MSEVEPELIRFRDLKARGILPDRATARRWMRRKNDPFPQPIVLSDNFIAWRWSEVKAWLDNRPRGPAPQPRQVAGHGARA